MSETRKFPDHPTSVVTALWPKGPAVLETTKDRLTLAMEQAIQAGFPRLNFEKHLDVEVPSDILANFNAVLTGGPISEYSEVERGFVQDYVSHAFSICLEEWLEDTGFYQFSVVIDRETNGDFKLFGYVIFSEETADWGLDLAMDRKL